MITIACLGNGGRFGNQLFQYAFARAYAESIGAELRTPDWIGRHIFKNINEEIMTDVAGPSTEYPDSDNVNLDGHFQQPHHLKYLSRSKVKKWFTFKDKLDIPSYDLVFHKRRGDYIAFSHIFATVTDDSYTRGAQSHGFDPSYALCLDDSRDQSLIFEDFRLMMNCKNLFRSNSTFAWWAATLGNCKVYSPIINNKVGIINADFVKGNDQPLGIFTGEMKISK